MSCSECERLSKAAILCTRSADHAQTELNSFVPEPPFDATVSQKFRALEHAAEECRTLMEAARRAREQHSQSHALSLS